MEMMPYQSHLEPRPPQAPVPSSATNPENWWRGVPCLTGDVVSLRELRTSDAPALFAALTNEQVARFISPPPATVEGFERFIAWAIRQRQDGQYLCFGVVPRGSDKPIGIFQVRSLEPAFRTAEWGFALAAGFWGTGAFVDGARLVVDYVFRVVGAERLEARAAVKNGRGNGALRKLGAVQEGLLRRSFLRRGEYLDQVLWTILPEEWRLTKTVWGDRTIH